MHKYTINLNEARCGGAIKIFYSRLNALLRIAQTFLAYMTLHLRARDPCAFKFIKNNENVEFVYADRDKKLN